MTEHSEIPVFLEKGSYFKDKSCTAKYVDQETAAVLWQLKQGVERSSTTGLSFNFTRRTGVKIQLILLTICALVMVGVSLVYWWPDLISRFSNPGPPPGATSSAAQAQQAMAAQLANYTDRVSDLEKLISVLLGLSAIYTLSLGLSSWVSVQSNLQQAEKWIQVQQSVIKDLKEQAQASVEKLGTLLVKHESDLEKLREELLYARVIPGVSASLSLAVQGKFVSDADLAARTLVKLRSQYPTDRVLNLYLGRAYKILGRLKNAIDAMSVFIRNKESAKEFNDADVADAYYNRACYRSLLWSKVAEKAEKDALQEDIVADIRQFVAMNEKLAADVKGDTDFDAVRSETWFPKL